MILFQNYLTSDQTNTAGHWEISNNATYGIRMHIMALELNIT